MSSNNAELVQADKALSDAAGLVVAAKAEFDKLSKNLDGQITGMAHQWQGQGGAAFMKLHTQWIEKQNKVVGALNTFEDSLRVAEKENVTADEAQSANMSKVASRLQ